MSGFLKKEELYLVKEKFHPMILDAWNKGENVPREIIHVSDRQLTEEELKVAYEVSKKYNLDTI